tara:strand:+ start:1452 stop:1838 length:387 start_codon:yes stop_codon:yes gene_type:complete
MKFVSFSNEQKRIFLKDQTFNSKQTKEKQKQNRIEEYKKLNNDGLILSLKEYEQFISNKKELDEFSNEIVTNYEEEKLIEPLWYGKSDFIEFNLINNLHDAYDEFKYGDYSEYEDEDEYEDEYEDEDE